MVDRSHIVSNKVSNDLYYFVQEDEAMQPSYKGKELVGYNPGIQL